MIILLENLKKIICVYAHHGNDILDRSTGSFLPAWSVHRTTSQVPSARSFHQTGQIYVVIMINYPIKAVVEH